MESFKARARQWVDYSNLKELTDEEQKLFDEVNLKDNKDLKSSELAFRSPLKFPNIPLLPLVTLIAIFHCVLMLIMLLWRRITTPNPTLSVVPNPNISQ